MTNLVDFFDWTSISILVEENFSEQKRGIINIAFVKTKQHDTRVVIVSFEREILCFSTYLSCYISIL